MHYQNRTKRSHLTRWTACLASLLLGSSCMALPAAAQAETEDYLALGDSISTGYGLAAPETEGFVYRVAEAKGYRLENHAVNGNTADGIYAQLQSGTLDASIADAEAITLTCGGNDLMALFYEQTAAQYNTIKEPAIAADEVLEILAVPADTRWFTTFMAARTVLKTFADTEAFQTTLDTYEQNLTNVMTYLRQQNADAEIILTTQYNPYQHFTGYYGEVNTGFDAGTKRLNSVILENADTLGYVVADVYTAFAAEGGVLTNADSSTMQLDFHPNAAGHALLAETVLETLETVQNQMPATLENVGFSTEYTYGQPIEVTAEQFATNSDASLMTFQWLDAQGEILTESPTQAGDYQLRVNVPAATYAGNAYAAASLELAVRIQPAVPELLLPTASELTYGQPLAESVLSDAAWQWQDGSVRPTVQNAGYPAVLQVPDAVNYDYAGVAGYDAAAGTVTVLIPVTVAKAMPTINPTLPEDPKQEGDPYPLLSGMEGDTAGTFRWLEDGTLAAGENVLTWQFVPEDADNYTELTGTVTIHAMAKETETTEATTSTETTTETETTTTTETLPQTGLPVPEGMLAAAALLTCLGGWMMVKKR